MSSLYRCHCDANPSSRWQNDGVPTHIALLRGINVGGRNRVAMADLREVVLGLGHTEVATYIQSGNVVFTSAELAQVVADNPFPDEPNPRWVHVIFRNGPLGPDELAAVAAAQQRAQDEGSDDEARVVGTTLFLHTPGGLGRSELAAQLTRLGGSRTAETAGTGRNWATVNKLLALAAGSM
jgi:uncharacterized protein (DUF1697 family)